MTVGFIGLGNMGAAIARRFLRGGEELIGYDPDVAVAASLVSEGMLLAGSPREVADAADVVFACLPSPEVSSRVALGEHGVGGGERIEVYAEISTIGAKHLAHIAEGLGRRGIAVVDSPVTGAIVAAQNGTLTAIVAGPTAAAARVESLWRHAASTVVNAGDVPGSAQTLKLANNFVAVAGLMAVSEVLAYASRQGVDEAQMIDLLNHGSGQNWSSSTIFPNVILPRVRTGTRVELGLKDLRLYLEDTEAGGGRSPLAEGLLHTFEMLVRARPDADWVDFYEHFKS